MFQGKRRTQTLKQPSAGMYCGLGGGLRASRKTFMGQAVFTGPVQAGFLERPINLPKKTRFGELL